MTDDLMARDEMLELLRATDIVGERETKWRCEESLYAFVEWMWDACEPETPFVGGWVLEAQCLHLEAVHNGEVTRLLMNVPPGSTKSLLCSVFFPAWEWGPRRMPHLRYLCCAYAGHLTMRDNRRFMQVIEHRKYQKFWGGVWQLNPKMYSITQVGNVQTGWKLASSVGGVGTGERADRIIIDDPNNPLEAESELIMRSTTTWFREVMPDRLNSLDKSSIIVIQQRTHDLDVSGTILDLGLPYCHLSIPMEFDVQRPILPTDIGWVDPRTLDDDGEILDGLNADGTIVVGSALAERDRELAWPERFSEAAIKELKEAKGSYAYCTPGESPVLMASGVMRSISKIAIGDQVLGFSSTEIIRTEVKAISSSIQPIWKIIFRDGGVARCTRDHLWLISHDGGVLKYGRAEIGLRLYYINGVGNIVDIKCGDIVEDIIPDGSGEVFGLTTGTGNYIVWWRASSNSAQYQMLPVPRGEGIIPEQFWQLWAAEQFPEYGTCVASLDTAFKTGQENDYSALTVWAAFSHPETEKPKLMLRDAWRARLSLSELVKRVARSCLEHKVDTLLVEDSARGTDVRDEIERLIGRRQFRIELIRPAGDKVSRLVACQPIFENGVIFAPDREWAEMVIREVTAFPFGRHDDLVDTVSQALIYLRANGVAVRRDEYDEAVIERRRYRRQEAAIYDV